MVVYLQVQDHANQGQAHLQEHEPGAEGRLELLDEPDRPVGGRGSGLEDGGVGVVAAQESSRDAVVGIAKQWHIHSIGIRIHSSASEVMIKVQEVARLKESWTISCHCHEGKNIYTNKVISCHNIPSCFFVLTEKKTFSISIRTKCFFRPSSINAEEVTLGLK